ncbi:MAG: methionyl-tRNA formyltransferase, partial [Candidatus Omnitrophica bacterium]|nr:methionyl-tRNA formyltransferase [Candidatus Omnitrophota bacterium]
MKSCLDSGWAVPLVITTPDRPKGRGLKLQPTPVKVFAAQKGLRVESPDTLNSPAFQEEVVRLKPDLFVVSSYGKIIPVSWLKIPAFLALNIHPSLLPRHRGASPMQWAILNGDSETGLTIFEVTDKLDSGDIFFQSRIPLDDKINAVDLSRQLADLSYSALQEVLGQIKGNRLKRIPQDDSKSSYARKLKKEDGRICWTDPALKIHNQVRGLVPWPTAHTRLANEWIQILAASVDAGCYPDAGSGEILEIRHQGS